MKKRKAGISSGSTYIHFSKVLIKSSEGMKQLEEQLSSYVLAERCARIDVSVLNTSLLLIIQILVFCLILLLTGFPIQHDWNNINQTLYFRNPLIGKERRKTCANDYVIYVL